MKRKMVGKGDPMEVNPPVVEREKNKLIAKFRMEGKALQE